MHSAHDGSPGEGDKMSCRKVVKVGLALQGAVKPAEPIY